MRRQSQTGKTRVQTADVLQHLGDSLRAQRRRYRRRLQHCQEQFSEDAVHDVRVEARRLLSTLELLGAFFPERDLRKARRTLRRHLDTFDQLRDTQVQLNYAGRIMNTFPDARPFHDWLQERKARFTRKTRKAVKQIKTKRLGRRLAILAGKSAGGANGSRANRLLPPSSAPSTKRLPGSRTWAGRCGPTTPGRFIARELRSSISGTWSKRWHPCCRRLRRITFGPCAATSV